MDVSLVLQWRHDGICFTKKLAGLKCCRQDENAGLGRRSGGYGVDSGRYGGYS